MDDTDFVDGTVKQDGDRLRDVFVRDAEGNLLLAAGEAHGFRRDGPTRDAALSGDGRLLAFTSFATYVPKAGDLGRDNPAADLDEGPWGDVFILDPMLATGHSSAAAVDRVRQANPRSMRFVALVAAPEGIAYFHDRHPDVPIFTAAVDRQLNERGYILPGLGDAGDRLFGC